MKNPIIHIWDKSCKAVIGKAKSNDISKPEIGDKVYCIVNSTTYVEGVFEEILEDGFIGVTIDSGGVVTPLQWWKVLTK